MIYTRALFAAVLLGLADCSTAQNVSPVPVEALADEGADEQPAISLPTPAEESDPDSLNRRLAYAQSQAESPEGECAQRLDQVQALSDAIKANPALDVIIPDGRARLANIGYRLHLGRASCGSEAAPRKNELRAALDIALGAVPLYRDLYDYKAMVVMQFDAAATWRMLGETDKALAALETAIAMDADYGFAEDAAENGELLQRWKKQPAAVRPVAVPKRSITLKFAWGALNADVDLTTDYFNVTGGEVIHSSGASTLRRHVQAQDDNWVLSSENGPRRYNFGAWRGQPASSPVRDTMRVIVTDLMPPDLKLGSKGEFKNVVDPEAEARALAREIDAASRDFLPEDDKQLDTTTALGRAVQFYDKPEGLETKAAEDYSLSTSAWTDTTLEQGVWYEMSAQLYMPGLALGMEHDIQFSYSRPVPCTRDAAESSCAEILVHATPNPDALEDAFNHLMRLMKLHAERGIQFASATDLRLVVDPNRLLPYVTETRRHWYLAIQGKGEPLIGSQKTVATYTYP